MSEERWTLLGQIGNFSSRIGKKTYFLALGMGPIFGPKFRRSRALYVQDTGICTDEMLRTGERIKTFQYFPARGGVYSLFKSHYSRYLFLYRGYAWGVRAIKLGGGLLSICMKYVYVLYK